MSHAKNTTVSAAVKRPLMIAFSVGQYANSSSCIPREFPTEKLFTGILRPPREVQKKGDALWYCGPAKNNVCNGKNVVSTQILTFDGDCTEGEEAEKTAPPFESARSVLDDLGVSFGLATTYSHDPENGVNRWRASLPLSRLVDKPELAMLATLLHDKFKRNGCDVALAAESCTIARKWFFPHCPPGFKKHFQRAANAERPYIDVDDWLLDFALSGLSIPGRPDKPLRSKRPDKPLRSKRPDKPLRSKRPDKPVRSKRPDKPVRSKGPTIEELADTDRNGGELDYYQRLNVAAYRNVFGERTLREVLLDDAFVDPDTGEETVRYEERDDFSVIRPVGSENKAGFHLDANGYSAVTFHNESDPLAVYRGTTGSQVDLIDVVRRLKFGEELTADETERYLLEQVDPRMDFDGVLHTDVIEARHANGQIRFQQTGETDVWAPEHVIECKHVQRFSDELVWIEKGSRVHRLTKKASSGSLPFMDVQRAEAGNLTKRPPTPEGMPRPPVQSFKLWQSLPTVKHPETFGRILVHDTLYIPKVGERIVEHDGERYINEFWIPPHEKPGNIAERVQPFLDHINYLCPIDEEREWFLSWFAFTVQHMLKRCAAPWHISPVEGTGRGWVRNFLNRLLGSNNVGTCQIAELMGKKSAFNYDYTANRLVTVVNEVDQSDVAKWDTHGALKEILLEDEQFVNQAHGAKKKMRVYTNLLFFSNSETALKLPPGDRRVMPIAGPDKPQQPEYYTALYESLDDDVFIAACYHWLMDRDLSQFRWQQPPLTETKVRATFRAMSPIEQAVDQYLEHLGGAKIIDEAPVYEALTIKQLMVLFSRLGLAAEDELFSRSAENHLGRVLAERNVTPMGQCSISGKHVRPYLLRSVGREAARESVARFDADQLP